MRKALSTKPLKRIQQPGDPKKFQAAVSDHILHHLAFDNSFLANIITIVSSGKIIVANNSACKLLGYPRKELLTKSRSDIFDIKEGTFKKMLKQRTAEGHSKALVTVIKKNGKTVPSEITSAVFVDQDSIKKAITTVADLGLSIVRQKKIDASKEKMVAENIALAKAKQKSIDTRKKKIVAENIVLARTKQKKIDIKKEKVVAENIEIAKLGQKKSDTIKKKIVADNIVLAQTKSDARLEEKLTQEIAAKGKLLKIYEESFRLIFNSSSDVLFDSDLINNEVIVSDAYEKEFGYKLTGNMTPADDWSRHIHPDDKERIMHDYLRMLASDEIEWKCSYRFLRADNTIADVISNRVILRNADGKAYRMIGSMQDVSKQTKLSEKLELEIKLKEKQIEEARQDARDTERSDIGRELHDNVNQLLGASKLYLDMAKRGGENSAMYLARSSEYTLNAIEEIRKLTKGLTTDIIKNLGLGDAIDTIIRDTMEINPIEISHSIENFRENSVNEKFKMDLFRIVQEQLNNILKHAKATKVTIALSQNKKAISLVISDNGVGFNTSQKQKGIGIVNIKNRATSYKGKVEFVSQPGFGCLLRATFPVTQALLN